MLTKFKGREGTQLGEKAFLNYFFFLTSVCNDRTLVWVNYGTEKQILVYMSNYAIHVWKNFLQEKNCKISDVNNTLAKCRANNVGEIFLNCITTLDFYLFWVQLPTASMQNDVIVSFWFLTHTEQWNDLTKKGLRIKCDRIVILPKRLFTLNSCVWKASLTQDLRVQ